MFDRLRALFVIAALGLAVSACSPGSFSAAPIEHFGQTPSDVVSQRATALADPAGKGGLSVLYSFGNAPDGSTPLAGVIVGKGGEIFGTASLGGASGNGAVFALKRSHGAYSETLVHSFDATDGAAPEGAPFEDASGNLFVTASAGGGSNQDGTLVELSPQKKVYGETGLFAFDSTDGAYPSAGFLDAGGTLYTTTNGGGAFGYGDIVRVSASGLTATDVYDFQNAPDGASPDSPLAADASGALYGTTYYGGNGECPQGSHLFYHCGVVFTFAPSPTGGTETVLYTFQGATDGASPYAGVLVDEKGNVYGTTVFGGDTGCGNRGSPDGCGTVFKLAPQKDGTYKESILHAFTGGKDGQYPYGGLVAKGDTLYGTTEFGGGSSACTLGCGTVFALSEAGTGYSVVHSFVGSDGANPGSTLFAKGKALYGTTADGGKTGNGVVFQFTP